MLRSNPAMRIEMACRGGPEPVALDLTADADPLVRAEIDWTPNPAELPPIAFAIPDDGLLASVKDPVRAVWFPQLLRPAQRRALESETIVEASLLTDGLLYPAGLIAERRAAWRHGVAVARAGLERDRFAVLPALLPGAIVRATAAYYRARWRKGDLVHEQTFCDRHFAHRDPLAEWLHQRVAELLVPVIGPEYRPSYSLVSAYRGPSELPIHTDRAQCVITVSLCVAATPGAERWPLHLRDVENDTAIDLRIGVGHAVVFHGRELAHGRPVLAAGEEFVTLLFHFVPRDFSDSLD
jgi:hypothetical protein